MKKNKIYLFISIIALICFFGTAAICNQCAADTMEEADSAATEDEATEEEPAEEEVSEEEGEAEAPAITIEIYEGPTYSSADDVCYYRVKAIVTGNPTPSVVFSKDDSGGAWGSKKVQINLGDPAETYTLTATATNSEGSDSDSIDLSWGCSGSVSNNPPEIVEIIFPYFFTGDQYGVEAIANDADGDSLSYQWSVTDGSILDDTSNPMEWTTPSAAGVYEITVSVEDGKGGGDTKTESVAVNSLLLATLPINEWGHVTKDTSICKDSTCKIMVGDYMNNKPMKGFVSFDINNIAGHKIVNAALVFANPLVWGDPTFNLVQSIRVEVADWGDDGLKVGDFDIGGIELLCDNNSTDFTCIDQKIIDTLQDAIDDGKDRYQIRVYHSGLSTNNNNTTDAWGYPISNISLQIKYYMPIVLP